MQKTDLTKTYKSYYTAKAKPQLLSIEKARYISISGKGDPSSEQFAGKISALYPVAYALKFMCKAAGNDFTVAKLEGLWWFDEQKFAGVSMEEAPVKIPRAEWEYRLLIRLPEFVSAAQVQAAVETVSVKKKLPLAKEVTYFEMEEGECVQALHTGPFDKEPETLSQIDIFMVVNALGKNGLHHEIYLSDFRKTPPEKLKTILREPVKKK